MRDGSTAWRRRFGGYLLLPPLAILVMILSCSSGAISEQAEPAVETTAVPESTTPAPTTAATQPAQPDVSDSVAVSDPAEVSASEGAGTSAQSTTSTIPPVTTTTIPPRDCTPSVPPDLRLAGDDPQVTSVDLSIAVYLCAAQVGIAPAADPAAVATLAASGLDGPLLMVGDRFTGHLMNEVRRLAPDTVLVAGLSEGMRRRLFEFDVQVVKVDPDAAPVGLPSEPSQVWLVAPTAPVASLEVLAARLETGVVVAEPDLRSLPAEARELIARAEELVLVSDFGEESAWQLDVVRNGLEIPGGGQLMFEEDSPRRLVALYGHPQTSVLGVLGEQSAEEGVIRLAKISAGYAADGATILPTFEIIATVASAGAGRDGDYSAETSRDIIRPWIETAAENDVYVVLDLQPGRTHFLTQAKIYEEFLRLPHVGLALDPEWRLKPHQVHLTQIGTVDAAEINEVVRWLAGIVREEALPQKLLIVHQFRFSMITNRELIETPPELAVVIQMDGQGSLGAKYNTWNVLTRGTEERGFRWGWKNFYDEDSPTATPEQVLDLTPVPVFVSYQ